MDGREEFYESLRTEMAMRARLLLAGKNRGKAGQMLPDDLVQEAMAKMMTAYDEASLRERPFNQLMALAYRTMRNLVIDQGRKKGAWLEDRRDDDEPGRVVTDQAPLPDELLGAGERVERVRSEMAKLAPEERCFLTQVMQTDSVPAAQKHCGWPPKSPYYVLRRLLSQLRLALRELEPEAVGG